MLGGELRGRADPVRARRGHARRSSRPRPERSIVQLGRLQRRRGAARRPLERARRRLRARRGRRLDRLGARGRPRGDRGARGAPATCSTHAGGDVARARAAASRRSSATSTGTRTPTRPSSGRINDARLRLRSDAGMARALTTRRPTTALRLYRRALDGEPRLRARRRSTTSDDLGVYFVATHPEHRGSGLASRLLPRRSPRRASAACAPRRCRLADGPAGLRAARLHDATSRSRCTSGRQAADDEPRPTSELEAAIEALTEPERFARPRRWSPRAAPRLQRILGQALEAGGWFAEAHEAELAQGARRRRPGGAARRASARCSPRRRGWG